jgi:hypothetical protein
LADGLDGGVPKRRIESLRITPLFDEKAVELLVWTNCAGAGSIRLGMSETPFTDGIPVKITLPEFTPGAGKSQALRFHTCNGARPR